MRWIAIALQVILALLFVVSGAPKLAGGLDEIRMHLQIAPWFWSVTGLVELIGAAALLAGLKFSRAAVFGGLWLAATMLGGVISHLLVGDPWTDWLAAAVLTVLSLAVAGLALAASGQRTGQLDGAARRHADSGDADSGDADHDDADSGRAVAGAAGH